MNLLRESLPDGFPTDYLLARIKGRRASLVADWQPLLAEGVPPGTSDEGIWEALLQEFEWLYRQMNRELRHSFAPVFLVFELKTIILCLRNKEIEERLKIDRLLSFSLLSERVQEALLKGTDIRSTVAAVTDCFASAGESFREMERAYADKGLKGFENSLMRLHLEHTVKTKHHPAIKEFFILFIDLRNLMILYKHLRWDIAAPPPFIAGGTVPYSRLREISEKGELAGLETFLQRVKGLTAGGIKGTESALETSLLRNMTDKLRRIGREADGVGLILDYLWRLYVEARNLALLHHGKDVDREALAMELIQ